MPKQLSDEEVARRVQAGRTESFGVLVKRYEAKITRYAKRFLFNYREVEDLVQEVFIKAYTNIRSFDPSRKFSSWLYRVAHNEFINAIKKKGKEPLPFFDLVALWPHSISKENVVQKTVRRETRKALKKCLGKLSPKYREP